jgi:hypothetical protein
MPGPEQIGLVLDRERAEPRPHQQFGRARVPLSTVQDTTAIVVRQT